LAFILEGNIAFNSDEAVSCLGIRDYLHGGFSLTTPQLDISGLRLWMGALIGWMTGEWVHFVSLAALIFLSFTYALWIRWAHERISPTFAFILLVFLAFPSNSSAYFSTHLERRLETFFWAALLVHFSGSWGASWKRLSVFGAILGWAFWNEPFILFFALPVVLEERWLSLRSFRLGFLVPMVLGLALGLLAGHVLNTPFYQLGPGGLKMGIADLEAVQKNAALLWTPFPQYWSGNFPFGYLQASSLGSDGFPMREGSYRIFVAAWFGSLVIFGVWAFLATWFSDRKSRVVLLLTTLPTFGYLASFLLSEQTWDATSFRYISFLSIGLPLLWAWGAQLIFRRNRRLAVALLLVFASIQCWLYLDFLSRVPRRHPALKVQEGFERIGLREGWAHHWAAESSTWLSGGKIRVRNYDLLLWAWVPLEDLKEPRIGLVHIEGLDRPDRFASAILALQKAGYRPHKEWILSEHWSILEFGKAQGPHRGRSAAP
jgi:hypothetical protein